ncbi:hypothetical protein H0H92_007684 [Tricholoma furcatifolium]|nr:hypothetical protein H0H92_007684 [Tricholoma furcatifolium]
MSDSVWQHFHKGTEKYGNDKNHWKTWFRGCIQARVLIQRASELNAVAQGNLLMARSEEQLQNYYLLTEKPRSGKIEEM